MRNMDVYDLQLEAAHVSDGGDKGAALEYALTHARAHILNGAGLPVFDPSLWAGEWTLKNVEEALRSVSAHPPLCDVAFRLFCVDEFNVPVVVWACRGNVMVMMYELVYPVASIDVLLKGNGGRTLVLNPGDDMAYTGWTLW